MPRKNLRRKVKTVYLGDSLSSNLTADVENALIVSWPNTPCSLDGLNLGDLCIDRIPIYVGDPKCINNLGFEARRVIYNYILFGEEEILKDKIYPPSIKDTHHFWYDVLPERYGNLYHPKDGWCSVMRVLRRRLEVPRIYANIAGIDPVKKEIRIEGGSILEYEKLVSTIPQDLLLTRLRGVSYDEVLKDYVHVPYNISAVIGTIEQGFGDYEVLVYALGKRRFISSHVILVKYPATDPNSKQVLIYVLTPLKREVPRSEILSKSISELRKIGIKVKGLSFIRSYVEKYGVVCRRGEGASVRLLAELGIEVRGRYGSWAELSVCDIVKEAGIG
ncbi:MAG: hypothetical protein QXK83_03730 [Zestosphaera sp.]